MSPSRIIATVSSQGWSADMPKRRANSARIASRRMPAAAKSAPSRNGFKGASKAPDATTGFRHSASAGLSEKMALALAMASWAALWNFAQLPLARLGAWDASATR